MNIRQPLYGQAADRVRDQLHTAALPAIPAQPTTERTAVSLPTAGTFLATDGAREHNAPDEPGDLAHRYQAGDPDAHLFSSVLVDGTVSLCADDTRLTTPEDTREAARQAAAFSRRLHELADQQEDAREHPDDIEILGALARECEKRGITLKVTDDRTFDMAMLINDGRTLIVPPEDDLAEILDDLTGIGRCIDCHNPLDATATPYADGYTHIDGSPIMICRSCRDKRLKLASDPGRLAFSRAMDAIEAVFQASKNPEMTRQALREFVNMTADAIHAGGTR